MSPETVLLLDFNPKKVSFSINFSKIEKRKNFKNAKKNAKEWMTLRKHIAQRKEAKSNYALQNVIIDNDKRRFMTNQTKLR